MDQIDFGQGELVHARNRPTLKFEDGSYTLPELLESHLLPVVAQYDSSCQPIPFHEFNFDLSQPLLLYKKRNIQKVVARSLYIDDEKYHEVGESLLIPEDYKGWFAVLQRITGNINADDTVPHFTTVEEVANSNTDRFLIGGTKKINGLQLLDRNDSQLKHEQRNFLPGDILTREKIYYGETKKRTRLFRKPKYITEKFLMCRDESDREILLPFEQTGIFYQISHKSGKANKQVMQMSDIVARKLTPRIIKLVFGRFPVTPCSFTGLMRAESSKIETSVIASTLINTKNILLEIPVSSAIRFRVAIMDNELRTNSCYRNAMSICAERAITYMRNIKVCYNFTTEDDEDDYWSRKDSIVDPASPSLSSLINNNNTIQTMKTFKQINDNKDSVSESLDTVNETLRRNHDVETRPEFRRGFSVDVSDDVTIRPGRCMSTAGRVSFCLGNNYLTVPMFESSFSRKRDSGNNNTIHEKTYTTRRGSKLSFNGTFFEEVEEENTREDVPGAENAENTLMPPPIPCTNIHSYVNVVSPPQISLDAEDPNYIPASGIRRPSTQAPGVPPPPLPRSSSTSGVSSGSLSSVSDETLSKRESSDSFEYAVPKIQDPNTILSDLSGAANVSNGNTHEKSEKPLLRRPSTFTFSEGCFNQSKSNFKSPLCVRVDDTDDTTSDEGSPVYENIQKLMELVSKLEMERQVSSGEFSPIDKPESPTKNDVEHEHEIEYKMTNTKHMDISGEFEENKALEEIEEIPEDDFACNENTIESEVCKVHVELDDSDKETCNKTRLRRIGVTEMATDFCNMNQEIHDDVPKSVAEKTSEDVITENEFSDFNNAEESVEECEDEMLSGLECCGDQLTMTLTECDDIVFSNDDNISNTTPSCENCVFRNEKLTSDANDREKQSINSLQKCRWKIALDKMKTSTEFITSKGKIKDLEKPFHCLSVDEIADALLCIGIKEGTINLIKTMGVDGARLTEVLDGDLSIRDCLCGVNLVDQQKISMFIRGWRPNSE